MSKTLDLKKVKAAIRDHGFKKGWVAEQIGVTPATFSGVLSGKRNLGPSAQILLQQILKLNEASDKAS